MGYAGRVQSPGARVPHNVARTRGPHLRLEEQPRSRDAIRGRGRGGDGCHAVSVVALKVAIFKPTTPTAGSLPPQRPRRQIDRSGGRESPSLAASHTGWALLNLRCDPRMRTWEGTHVARYWSWLEVEDPQVTILTAVWLLPHRPRCRVDRRGEARVTARRLVPLYWMGSLEAAMRSEDEDVEGMPVVRYRLWPAVANLQPTTPTAGSCSPNVLSSDRSERRGSSHRSLAVVDVGWVVSNLRCDARARTWGAPGVPRYRSWPEVAELQVMTPTAGSRLPQRPRPPTDRIGGARSSF
jgi:hypothetical protein